MTQRNEARRLRRAAKLLARPNGWATASLRETDSQGGMAFCMLGALAQVDGLFAEYPHYEEHRHGSELMDRVRVPAALLKALPARFVANEGETGTVAVYTYNDDARTTQCDVVQTLCRAADIAEAEAKLWAK